MVVITVSNCPPALRGDITLWLMEIDTGVYVGSISARVRERLWLRITENIKDGRATMIYSSNNEQKLRFRVHKTIWEPVDFDGLQLVMRPAVPETESMATLKHGFSNAAKNRNQRFFENRKNRKEAEPAEGYQPISGNEYPEDGVIIDVQTTGLNPTSDQIIELSAVRFREFRVVGQYSATIENNCNLADRSTTISVALMRFFSFLGSDAVITHNMRFALAFLQVAVKKCGQHMPVNSLFDTVDMARKHVQGVSSLKLTELLDHFSITDDQVTLGTPTGVRSCLRKLQLYKHLYLTIASG